MCGICVVASPFGRFAIRREMLETMCEVLRHRGPDEDGYFLDRPVGLGVRRLRVIDPKGGHQPVYNEDKSVVATCNGIIYNYKNLRARLIESGHSFRSEVDTEVLVHAYEEYGDSFVKYLDGMFAIAIWDARKNRLVLARDRIGIKPIYYFIGETHLVAASELKSLLRFPGIPRNLDYEALDLYLTFEYIPRPYCIFADIRPLEPGHILIYDEQGHRLRKYWDLDLHPIDRSPQEIATALAQRLRESVKSMLVSDVPLGAFLSGGIDSSCVVALLAEHLSHPVPTFSIGFADRSYDERPYAREVSRRFRTDHHEWILTPKAVDLVYEILDFLDEPLADFSIFPTFLVSKLAKEFVTVVLSGDGGDELFGGYDTYAAQKICLALDCLPETVRRRIFLRLANLIPPASEKKSIYNMIRRFLAGASLPACMQHTRWMVFLSAEDKRELYSEAFGKELENHDSFGWLQSYLENGESEQVTRWLSADLKTYLVDDILVKVDRMSMANSLEVRVPFLGHSFVEFAMRVPGNMKIRRFQRKWILKKAFGDMLPKSVLRRGKQGFSIPMRNWLRSELVPMLLDALAPARIERVGLFRRNCIERWIEEHRAGVDDHSHRLWALMLFHLWHDLYIR